MSRNLARVILDVIAIEFDTLQETLKCHFDMTLIIILNFHVCG
jgi:hypothetical protein